MWLAGYAVAFTLAYTLIGAGVGALLLFGAVQATMILSGLISGERPRMLDWVGLALAMTGLGWLTLRTVDRPDPTGALLMIIAGACWGAYSIAGRRSHDPMATTAGNFWRGSILAAMVLAPLVSPSRISWGGAALATASGALASGLGYTIWYSVLPALGSWRAAIVQLTVPVVTGLAAALILGETITSRLVIAAILVGTGVGLSLRKT
jgi:drug/metabolite transporter (DMT)-like permease